MEGIVHTQKTHRMEPRLSEPDDAVNIGFPVGFGRALPIANIFKFLLQPSFDRI